MLFRSEEIAKKISISLAAANGTYKGVKINILDVPVAEDTLEEDDRVYEIA